MPEMFMKFKQGHLQWEHQMQVRYVKVGNFWQITRYNSETVWDRDIVSIKVKYAVYQMVTLLMILSDP